MSTNPPIAKYPLDRTGVSLTNRVENEIREANTPYERAFVPKGGPFYTESMKIFDEDTGDELVPVDDYILFQPFQQAALRTGFDVQCVVWIKKPTPFRVRMEYQVVGGEYSWNFQAMIDMVAELDLDNRPVLWGSIVGRPTAYPPAPHIHDIGDTYGWEYVVYELEGIRKAILVGDEASHEELRNLIRTVRDELLAAIGDFDARLTAHIDDHDNPHRVTKAQTGLGNVENYPPATNPEALAGTANNRYMTPALTTLLAQRLANEAVNAHIADKNNPHGTTKAQVGLGLVQNYGVATEAEAISGVASDKYMTADLTRVAIAKQVGETLTAHINNTSNPHAVTKAQVGLGLVENYGVASVAEAQAGTANDRYMTPFLTKAAIDKFAGDALQEHINNRSNPHAVTKTQVGLGAVDNFATATSAEARAGTAQNRFMTASLTAEAIAAQVGDSYNAHRQNTNNPHGTTAAQVGAYSTAQSDAQLAGKLGKTEQAVDSNRLGGSTKGEVLAEAYAAVGSNGKRNLFVAQRDPTAAEGVVGDVWYKY